MKNTNLLALSLTSACLAAAQADVLLDDTWVDASRGETSLPTESAVWAGTPGSVTMSAGSLTYAQSTGSQKLWTFFAGDGSPLSIGVGQQLIATIDFTPRVALYDNSSRSFRFGLFNDPTPGDAQLTSDTNSDSGGGLWTDSTGYGVQLALSTGATKSANVQLGKRTDPANTSLMGSSGAWTFTTGGNPIINTLDTSYTLTLELDRTAVDVMNVTFTMADAGGVISTYSIVDDPNGAAAYGTGPIATEYEQLFFRFSTASSTADAIEFTRFKIELVPEPSTLALLGLGGLALLIRRRS